MNSFNSFTVEEPKDPHQPINLSNPSKRIYLYLSLYLSLYSLKLIFNPPRILLSNSHVFPDINLDFKCLPDTYGNSSFAPNPSKSKKSTFKDEYVNNLYFAIFLRKRQIFPRKLPQFPFGKCPINPPSFRNTLHRIESIHLLCYVMDALPKVPSQGLP